MRTRQARASTSRWHLGGRRSRGGESHEVVPPFFSDLNLLQLIFFQSGVGWRPPPPCGSACKSPLQRLPKVDAQAPVVCPSSPPYSTAPARPTITTTSTGPANGTPSTTSCGAAHELRVLLLEPTLAASLSHLTRSPPPLQLPPQLVPPWIPALVTNTAQRPQPGCGGGRAGPT
jgi:hypothetical protein